MSTTKTTIKKLIEIVKAPAKHWVGNGFHVHSMFSYDDNPEVLSPFLLLDFMAPETYPPSQGERRGVGEHPHRGFETVTILHSGEVEHRDSAGNKGKLGPGDVQWMTAASGVVHEEKHSLEFTKKGGTFEGAQLWVNLPKKFKMTKAKYQDIPSGQIPTAALPDGAGSVRVIAGEYNGSKGPASTHTPINLWDLTLKAGRAVDLKFTDGHTLLLHGFRGAVTINGAKTLKEAELAILHRQGETITLKAEKDSELLLMSGEPIDEPVVGYGPFVMNSHAEISQAIEDYEGGKMGTLEG
jgi:redox-sensitive bicupin YhaK (pirin superfamily)